MLAPAGSRAVPPSGTPSSSHRSAPTASPSVICCFLVSLRTLGSLQAAPGLMIVQKVAIKGAWEAGWRREQEKPNSADLGAERATGRSCGQRLRVPDSGACSAPAWRPEATAITAP